MFLETLTKLMNERGLTKSMLAKDSGIPYTTIDGFYKKGCDNVKLSTLQKLAKYFNVTLDYLIFGDNVELTRHEKAVIMAYRNSPDMQPAVDRLLGVPNDADIAADIERTIQTGENMFKEILIEPK